MEKNRFAAGIVMVPCFLLSAAFFSTTVWGDVPGENQSLALGLGGLLLAAGLLALLIPSTNTETKEDETDPSS
ncbi:MAG: GIVxVP protein [Synechococcus sp. ArSW.bin.68]